jgi:hypothetical protein
MLSSSRFFETTKFSIAGKPFSFSKTAKGGVRNEVKDGRRVLYILLANDRSTCSSPSKTVRHHQKAHANDNHVILILSYLIS